MPPVSKDGLRHLPINNTAETHKYTYPKPVRGRGVEAPARHTAAHGARLQRDLAGVRASLPQLDQQRQAVGILRDRGVYLEVESDPEFELALKKLDRRDLGKEQRHIELASVREEASKMFATVYIPEGKLAAFERLVVDYMTKTDRRSGLPRNRELVESMSRVRRAVLRSFWTDKASLFPPADQPTWWEVWLRAGNDRDRIYNEFVGHAKSQGIRIGDNRLNFPDRTVCLAFASASQLTSSVELLDCVAELRKAKDLASFFSEMGAVEQAQWSQDLVANTVPPKGDAPAVCVLDSGATRQHPVLAVAFDEQALHTCENEWGTGDSERWGGHGTKMCGLSLYGDLTVTLAQSEPVELEHQLESVKILPPGGYPANDAELYGAITEIAASLPEIVTPDRRRVYALAVTTDDSRDRGSPSSWSAAIDGLAFGDGDGGQRLFVVSAGNVDDREMWKDYPNSNDIEEVHDPGQAWNAVTVGGYTEKVMIRGATYPGWSPVAPLGCLSPTSTTSVKWKSPWPTKPDIVFEAGNAAVNPATGNVDLIDDLALLTTHWRPTEKLFVPTGDTSAATAQAARFAAILSARYPDYWPETLRALLVHSAEWTKGMRDQTRDTTDFKTNTTLLRRFGWGVPSLDRACWCADNHLTLVAQQTLRPYGEPKGGNVPSEEMHFYELPWPRDQLHELFDKQVTKRVTLSYFVEPNPARRGWRYRHRYQSHGLRFSMRRSDESLDEFKARVNKKAQDEDANTPDFHTSNWVLGVKQRNRGSIHSDWWPGTAADLADRGYLAVFPVTGWWKERMHLERWRNEVRYSLIVSIHAPEVGVDIYTPVKNMVSIPTAIAT